MSHQSPARARETRLQAVSSCVLSFLLFKGHFENTQFETAWPRASPGIGATLDFDTPWYGTLQYGTLQYGTRLFHITVRYSMVRYSTVRYSMVRYSTVRYATVPQYRYGGVAKLPHTTRRLRWPLPRTKRNIPLSFM